MRTASRFRLAAACAAVLALAVATPPVARAQTSDAAAQQAAREIQAARERANNAAQAWVEAETKLDELGVEQARLEVEVAELAATVEELRGGVEDLALDRFLNGDAGAATLFTGLDGPTKQVEAGILARVATDAGETSIDAYEAAQNDLNKKREQLERKKKETEQAQATFKKMKERALAEVVQLKKIEEQRLKDEAVRRALEAQLAEQRRRLQEQAEKEARDREAMAKAQEAARAAAEQSANPGGSSGGSSNNGTPAPDAGGSGGNPADGSNGGSAGGSTGGESQPIDDSGAGTTGGGGSRGGDGGGGGAYVDFDIVCPIATSAYGDTWGAPRSGGRRHQGVDMISPRGTEIYAVVDGYASWRSNRLGGNAVWLSGNNGNKYYYAHLDSYVGDSRTVSQGELIGYNGDTGNARGTPHLHFEVHPGGGEAVNPTPSVRAAGC